MNDPAELAIRLRRAIFNDALAKADLAAIEPLLSTKALLVTGTDSAVLAGRKAQLLAWKREFAAADRTVYVRRPETVIVSTVEPIALEHGHWQGLSQTTGQSVVSGSYSAKWRKLDIEWLLEAEIYLTLT